MRMVSPSSCPLSNNLIRSYVFSASAFPVYYKLCYDQDQTAEEETAQVIQRKMNSRRTFESDYHDSYNYDYQDYLIDDGYQELPPEQQLHLAALRGDVVTLRSALDSGKVTVDCKDKEGTTPLILAAANDHLDCVVELLDRGADPTARRLTGTCALFFAAQGGYLEVVQELLNKGAPVDLPSYDGGTPLFVACQCDHLPVVQVLLDHGADLFARMVDGASPLFIAAQNGRQELVTYLLEKGAAVNLSRKDGATPLWISCQMGHAEVAKELLDNGAEIDAAREDGATPLFKAAHKGHTACVEVLLPHHPDLGLLSNGESGLHGAAAFCRLPVLELLTTAGADVNLKNKDGRTPIQLAKQNGCTEAVEFLKSLGATLAPSPDNCNVPDSNANS